MENYSFREYFRKYFAPWIGHLGFAVDQEASCLSVGDQDHVIRHKSRKCQWMIFLEVRSDHRVYFEIAPVFVNTPDPWIGVDVVCAFVTPTHPDQWYHAIIKDVAVRELMAQH